MVSLLMKPVFILAILIPVIISVDGYLLERSRGFHFRIYVIADENVVSRNEVIQMINTVNSITSRELNLHLQFIGLKMYTWEETVVYQDIEMAADVIHYMKDFDHLIIIEGSVNTSQIMETSLYTDDQIFRRNLTCYWRSIGVLYSPLIYLRETTLQIVTSIITSNFWPSQSSSCLCKKATLETCIEETFEIERSKVIQCQKDLFSYVVENKINLFSVVPVGKNISHNCLERDTDAQLTQEGLEICGNGIVEEAHEDCDCDYYDSSCKKECDSCSWTDHHWTLVKEGQSLRFKMIIVVLVVVMIVVIICGIGFCIRNWRKSRESFANIISTLSTVESSVSVTSAASTRSER